MYPAHLHFASAYSKKMAGVRQKIGPITAIFGHLSDLSDLSDSSDGGACQEKKLSKSSCMVPGQTAVRLSETPHWLLPL